MSLSIRPLSPCSTSILSIQCGAPKKGHVCPYQPKLKRRPEEPPPVLRNAAVQVEMDEVRDAPDTVSLALCYSIVPHMLCRFFRLVSDVETIEYRDSRIS